jgi:hypothetical protein
VNEDGSEVPGEENEEDTKAIPEGDDGERVENEQPKKKRKGATGISAPRKSFPANGSILLIRS